MNNSMDVSFDGTTYILVIDTNAYSGNFEREISGYCAGAYDGETHGGKEQALFEEEEGEIGQRIMAKVTMLRHDEYGDRPCTIRSTPGRLNNGMGFHYDVGGDEEDAKARAKESARAYKEPHIKLAQDRLDNNDFEDKKPGAWTKAACERTIASALAFIEMSGQHTGYPAYESVAIFFSEPLTAEEMEVVERRARCYAQNPKEYTGSILGNKPFEIRDIYMTNVTVGPETEVRL